MGFNWNLLSKSSLSKTPKGMLHSANQSAVAESHVANPLKRLCHSQRFWANERARKLDL